MSYFITAHSNYKKSIKQSIHGEPISCVSIHDKDSSMEAWVDLAAATRHSLKYTVIRHCSLKWHFLRNSLAIILNKAHII
jgi:hypothetical protein